MRPDESVQQVTKEQLASYNGMWETGQYAASFTKKKKKGKKKQQHKKSIGKQSQAEGAVMFPAPSAGAAQNSLSCSSR